MKHNPAGDSQLDSKTAAVIKNGRLTEITASLTKKLVSGVEQMAMRTGVVGIMGKAKLYSFTAKDFHLALMARVEFAKVCA